MYLVNLLGRDNTSLPEIWDILRPHDYKGLFAW